MPSFISICIHNTNMYSSIFLPAVISICHLPDQLDESCLLRERGQKGSISWKPVLELPAIYVKSLFHALTVLGLSPHSLVTVLQRSCIPTTISLTTLSPFPIPSLRKTNRRAICLGSYPGCTLLFQKALEIEAKFKDTTSPKTVR